MQWRDADVQRVTAGNYSWPGGLTDGVNGEFFSVTATTGTNPGICVALVQGCDTSVPAALPRPALNAAYTDVGYFGESQAVANPDLTKVLFASNWGATLDTQVTDYLILLPACALP